MSERPGSGLIVSVGYEGRSLDEFIELLGAAGVETLVDVRLNPVSRKPGFSKTRLSAALGSAGIGYRHEPLLGNPRSNRDGFRKGWPSATRRYRNRLDNGSADAFRRTIALARQSRVALMCFEHLHAECHRAVIIDCGLEADPELRVLKL